MHPSKHPSKAVNVSDTVPVTNVEALRAAVQEALSESDGTMADLETRLLAIQRRLLALGSKESSIPGSDK
ncbi:MAG: hypothetical protein M1600_02845 [Firmicutes bacterium]|jgi:hypothetical protein|nr:hypothetical protein [Bacillota bacterium]